MGDGSVYDTLISGGHLLTMAGEGAGFVADGAVGVEGGKIVAVGPRAVVEGNATARRTIDATGRLVMPGLIDAHLHSASVIGRGWAQEVQPWMASAYGPLMAHAADADAPIATLWALMEGVANGTTTFGDYDAPMEALVHSHVRLGNRAVVCGGISELNWANRAAWLADGWTPGDPTPLDRAHGEAALAAELDLHERWHGHDGGRISVILGPHAADFLSGELLVRAAGEARRRGISMHLHVAQDVRENEATLRRAGLRAIPYLDSLGLLGPDLIAVHLSTATPDEVALVAARGARMVCCANSIGIIDGVVPPVAAFQAAGGLVGLGSDQAPGNNSHNIFAEMRAVAMFAKIAAGSPLPMPAWRVVRMATIEGARVLGIGDRVGSLEEGKEADLILLDLDRPPLAPALLRPARNLVPNLVYAESGRNVRLSMVAGEVIYADGEFLRVDRTEALADLTAAAIRLQNAADADPTLSGLPIVELTRSGRI